MKPPKKYSNLSRVEINYIKKTLNITKMEEIDISIFKILKERLKKIRDKRCKGKISFKIWDVVICTIIASFADNNTWEEIRKFVLDNYKWFKSFLQMTGGVPKESSFERIMGMINKDELNNILYDFFNEITIKKNSDTKIYCFDGRVNNGSKRKETLFNDEKKPLNCLNCYDTEKGYCFITQEIDEKTNEIPTIENEVGKMDLTNIITTWDALNTQTKNVAAVIEANGDYIIPVKRNHGAFYDDLIAYFDEENCSKIKAGNTKASYTMHIEKSHSSVIKYEFFLTTDIDWYCKIDDWKGVKCIGLVRKTITKKEKVKSIRKNAKDEYVSKEINTIENKYYISSRNNDIKEFAEVARSEWHIENKIHWHLDYTFLQDKNTTTNKNALLNLEVIHKFNLAILNKIKPRYEASLRCIRKHISHSIEEFFPELIAYLIVS